MDLLFNILSNTTFLSIIIVTLLSLIGLSVPLALILGTFIAGISSGMSLSQTLIAFFAGTTNGVTIALNYGFLGIFAAGLNAIELPKQLMYLTIQKQNSAKFSPSKKVNISMLFLLICGICSQTIIPIHIAFIPVIVPVFLQTFNQVKLDRRIIACILTFGLVATYGFLPFGFGEIFLKEIVIGNLYANNVYIPSNALNIMKLTAIPIIGMFLGLIVAIKYSYRKPREYNQQEPTLFNQKNTATSRKNIFVGILAIVIMIVTQIAFKSMMIGALCGTLTLIGCGAIKIKSTEHIVSSGFGMMATIGMIMIIAAGYANVLSTTGSINDLVNLLVNLTSSNTHLTILLMLFVGLIITIGIGSSFSTVPILAAIFIPICKKMGMSNEGTFIILTVSGMLGDAGSAASDSTLGPTAGLNIDNQHDHFKDSVIPTFLHFNIPLLIFGYLAAMLFF